MGWTLARSMRRPFSERVGQGAATTGLGRQLPFADPVKIGHLLS